MRSTMIQIELVGGPLDGHRESVAEPARAFVFGARRAMTVDDVDYYVAERPDFPTATPVRYARSRASSCGSVEVYTFEGVAR